jgi:lipopolysaccharide/colanic/teichoic acid biosynthesis glycosyltransferase
LSVASLGDGSIAASPAAPSDDPMATVVPPGVGVEGRPPAVGSPALAPLPEPLSLPARSRRKRALDLAVALAAAPIVVPFGLLCAALIRATSRGPALFRQERVGLGGQTFSIYKFRTMRVDAEERLNSDPELWSQYVEHDYKVPASVDSRVTRLGRWLRRTSIDELPQLLNVVAGSMSLVGPRPVVPAEVDKYGEHLAVYLSARPGITGAWQVNGRSNVDYPDRVHLDTEYVRTWSLWGDVKILARTPIAVLSTRGAF